MVLVIRAAEQAVCALMLSERHAAMLDFERSWWTNDDPRDQVVRARFQCSPEEYDAEIAVCPLYTSDAVAYSIGDYLYGHHLY